MNFGTVLGLVLVRVARMDSVSHISREQETPVHASVVVLLAPVAQGTVKACCYFNSHVTVSTLSRLRADLFMVEKHDHVDFSMISALGWCFGVLNHSIKGSKTACKVV